MKISAIDQRILAELQRDASVSLAQLSERVGVAQSTLWRRINDLEAAGVILARVAILDPAKIDQKLCILAHVSLEDHSEEAVAAFTRLVTSRPEILECHKVSGLADYIIKIRAPDVEAYEAFQSHHLLRNPFVRSVQSSFVLKEVKATTALPL
ncbi:MAG: Lrp/AsnC family transcriptional regulator [Paracoccaceae bacterium]|nr:Lrp/AsnC family transcriptional regulator [Paracoccaceae bacterium]